MAGPRTSFVVVATVLALVACGESTAPADSGFHAGLRWIEAQRAGNELAVQLFGDAGCGRWRGIRVSWTRAGTETDVTLTPVIEPSEGNICFVSESELDTVLTLRFPERAELVRIWAPDLDRPASRRFVEVGAASAGTVLAGGFVRVDTLSATCVTAAVHLLTRSPRKYALATFGGGVGEPIVAFPAEMFVRGQVGVRSPDCGALPRLRVVELEIRQ